LEPFIGKVFSTWDATLVKDAASATFDFTITDVFLELVDFHGNSTSLTATAFFGFTILLDGTEVFRHFTEILGHGGNSATETFRVIRDFGPLTSRGLMESGLDANIDYIDTASLLFDPYSSSVDLSGIAVGDTFDITYDLSLVAIGFRRGENINRTI